MKKPVVKQIAVYLTQEEMRQFELVKAYHSRSSSSDMLRVLIKNEVEKILPKNKANALMQQTT